MHYRAIFYRLDAARIFDSKRRSVIPFTANSKDEHEIREKAISEIEKKAGKWATGYYIEVTNLYTNELILSTETKN